MKKKDFMKKLLYFMKDYKKESVLAPLFKMLEAFFELFVPLVVASIIDDGIVPKDSGHIIRMCLLLLVLAAVGLTCSITAQYFAAKSAVGAATGIRYERNQSCTSSVPAVSIYCIWCDDHGIYD